MLRQLDELATYSERHSESDVGISAPRWTAEWIQKHMVEPAKNSALEAVSVFNFNPAGIPRDEQTQASFGSPEWMAETGVKFAIGIVPYVLMGRATGAASRAFAEANAMERSILGKFAASEMQTQVAGAALYDAAKNPRDGETRPGNVAGNALTFGIIGSRFGAGSALSLFAKPLIAGAIGSSTVQLISQPLDNFSAEKVRDSALTSLLIPGVQHVFANVANGVDHLLSRGIPAPRYASAQGWSDLAAVADTDARLVRVKEENEVAVIRNGKTLIVPEGSDVEARRAAFAHDLFGHKVNELELQRLLDKAATLIDIDPQAARQQFLDARRADEHFARSQEAKWLGKPAPPASDSTKPAPLDAQHEGQYERETQAFLESKGVIRPSESFGAGTADGAAGAFRARLDGHERPELDRAGFPLDEGVRRFIPGIVEKYKVAAIEEGELLSIVERFPQGEQPLAVKILEHGLPNSSEVLFAAQMKSLSGKLETALNDGGSTSDSRFISVDHAGWGRAFGYLYRKLSLRDERVFSLDPAALPSKTKIGVLLDDPSSTDFTRGQLNALKRLDKLYVLDSGGFETGINFLDYAQGPHKVESKLQNLVAAVRKLKESHADASDEQLIEQVVRGHTVAQATKLNKNSVVLEADKPVLEKEPQVALPPTSQAVHELISILNTPKATPDKIEQFLSGFVPNNQQSAAYVLAEGGQNITYRDMFKSIDDLHEKIGDAAGKQGLSHADLLFEDPQSSDSVDLVNYMYRIAKAVPADRFVAAAELRQMDKAEQLAGRGIVFLDDQSLTGDKIGKRFGSLRETADQSSALFFATMLYEHGPIFGEIGPPSAPWHILHTQRMGGFSPSRWEGSTDSQLTRAQEYAHDSGFITGLFGDPGIDFMYPTTSSNATVIWPFAIPDNDVSIMRRFGRNVLGLRQVMDPEPKPLDSMFKNHVPFALGRHESERDFLSNGNLKLDPEQEYYWKTGTATVFDDKRQLPVNVVKASRLGSPMSLEESQLEIARLNEWLDLTPCYPAVVVRAEMKGGKIEHYIVSEQPQGEEMVAGLYRLSNQARENMSAPSILQKDPEVRQLTERALVERLLLAPDRHIGSHRMLLNRTTDGTLYASNPLLENVAGPSTKPVWTEFGDISREFAKTQLSDDTYRRLSSAYRQIDAASAALSKSPWQLAGVTQRLEWFLEHRRFPDSLENKELIH